MFINSCKVAEIRKFFFERGILLTKVTIAKVKALSLPDIQLKK